MRNRKKTNATSFSSTGMAVATAPPPTQPMAYATTTVPPAIQVKPSGPPKPTSLYFVNAFVDFSVIGGLSIVAYLVLAYLILYLKLQNNERVVQGITITALLAWVCNWPHFSATNYRLYHSIGNIMQYPLTALLVPWLILVTMIGAILSPLVIAPMFVKLFFWWSSYHFCGQSFGITMIYARRAGFSIGRWERLGRQPSSMVPSSWPLPAAK